MNHSPEPTEQERRMLTVIGVGAVLIVCAFLFLFAEFPSLATVLLVTGVALFGYGLIRFPSGDA